MSLPAKSVATILIPSLILLVVVSSSQSNEATDRPDHHSQEHTELTSYEHTEVLSLENEEAALQHHGRNSHSRLNNDNGFGETEGNLGEATQPKNKPQNRPFIDVSEEKTSRRKKREANAEDVRELYNLTKVSQQQLGEFLSVLNITQKWQLIAIAHNFSLSKNQVEQQTDAWAAAQGGSVEADYEHYKQTLEAILTEMLSIHSQIAQNLSAEAQAVDADLIAILTNNDLNMKEQCQETAAVLANTTQEIKIELQKAFGPLPGSFSGYGRRGAGHGLRHKGHGRPFWGNSPGQLQQFGHNSFAQGGDFFGQSRANKRNDGHYGGDGSQGGLGGSLRGDQQNSFGGGGQGTYERGNEHSGWGQSGQFGPPQQRGNIQQSLNQGSYWGN